MHYSNWATRTNVSSLPWLNEFRAKHREIYNKFGFPTKQTEHFRFDDLTPLHQIEWGDKPAENTKEFDESELKTAGLQDTFFPNATRLVFVDGELNTNLTTCQSYIRFSDANSSQQTTILALLEQSDFSRNVFASAICANIGDGIYINASELRSPLEILHVQTQQSVHTNALVFELKKNDEAVVVERFLGRDAHLQQTHTVIDVDDNAHFTHYRLNADASLHLGQVDYLLSRDSRLDAFHLGFGSLLKRIDLNVRHRDSGAHAQLNGIYISKAKEQIDYHSTIEHTVPYCESDEVFRGILAEEAVGVFNGRIHIHPDAQKTRAELSNKNLLLDVGAHIYTKPELEIYADDVICAHGATVSRPDEEELFYLHARGIEKSRAELMLTFAFINALLDDIKHEEIAVFCRPLLSEKLS